MQKDSFDYIDDGDTPKRGNRSGLVWNILTVLVLLTTVCAGIMFLAVFINPSLGPFPPPAMPVRVELDTPTPTPKSVLPPTWTPTIPPPEPTATNTPVVVDTPIPTQQATAEGGDTDTGENPGEGMPVIPHEGSPQDISSGAWHAGCDWLGVAGQVVDLEGASVVGLIIELGGNLDGKQIGNPTLLTSTGLATGYGPGGYEIKLADKPVESLQSLWIRVLDQAGLPLSDKIYFDTFTDCDKNLIILYFKQVR